MDYRSLILPPPLALIDPGKAINLHSNRAATQRRAGADLIGVPDEGQTEGVLILRVDDNANKPPPPSPADEHWSVQFSILGDVTGNYPGAASDYYVIVGSLTGEPGGPDDGKRLLSSITHSTGTVSRPSQCGGNYTGSHTLFLPNDFMFGSGPGTITTYVKSTDAVVEAWSGMFLCHHVDAVPDPSESPIDFFKHTDPP